MPKRNGQTFSGLTGRTSGLKSELTTNAGAGSLESAPVFLRQGRVVPLCDDAIPKASPLLFEDSPDSPAQLDRNRNAP